MDEDKAPEKEESAEVGNEEIDIYLFSNGQQYSPPRKYHLRADELAYWEPTLAYLARLQYGSLNSNMELYELDGRKVEDVSDIRDCAVYVAVLPPDPFIYAGYDKYLVKASRSYEKRFLKKGNSQLSNPDTKNDPVHNQTSTPVKGKEMSPQCVKNCLCKSSLKYSNQKMTDRIKPVANQISQHLKIKYKSDDATKVQTNNNIRETLKTRALTTTPGMPSKILNSDLSKDPIRAKPPAKTLAFDTNVKNGIRQKCANLKTNPNTILKNSTTTAIKTVPTPLCKISKPTNNITVPEIDETMGEDLILDNNGKQSSNHLHSTINDLSKSVNGLSKSLLQEKTSQTDHPPFTLHDMFPATEAGFSSLNIIKTPVTSKKADSLPHSVDNKIESTLKEVKAPKSTISNSVVSKTRKSNIIKEFNNKFNASAFDKPGNALNNKRATAGGQNKNSRQSNEKQDPKRITENALMKNEFSLTKSITANDIQKSNNKSIDENIVKAQKISVNTKNCNVNSKLTSPASPPILKNLNIEIKDIKSQLLETETKQNTKECITVLNKINPSESDNTFKIDLDLISLLNDTTASTEPHSFVLMSEDKPVINNKERIIIVNKRNEIINPILNSCKSDILNEVDSNALISIIPENVINRSPQSSLESEIPEINVPVLNNIPKTFDHISNVHLDVTQNQDYEKTNAFPLSKTSKSRCVTDVVIKAEDLGPTKLHSFLFYVKKEYDKNTVQLKDSKANMRSNIQDEVSNIIKKRNIIHINVFRTSIDEPKLPCTDDCEIQSKTEKRKYTAEKINIDDHSSEMNVTTSHKNQLEDENNTSATLKTLLQKVTTEETESDNDQFIARVQDGDTINLKLSIQVKNADGQLKSTQTTPLRKSSSGSQLGNVNKIHKHLTGSKSLESVIFQSPPHLCCRTNRNTMYQCPCCNYKSVNGNTNHILVSNFSNQEPQGLYVLLPISSYNASVKPPIECCDKEVQHTESLMNFCVVQTVEQEIRRSQLIVVPSQTSPMDSKTQQTHKIWNEQFSQTDWCDVLLEARAEPDGHYTFYLPPLSAVQQLY